MNNKIVFLFFILIIIFGAGIFFVNGKKQVETPPQSTQTIYSSPTVSQIDQPSAKSPSPTTTNASTEVLVTLTPQGFSPQSILVKKGGKVTWTNQSGNLATVNSDVHPTHLLYPPLNLGEFDNNQSFQLTFDKVGKFTYHNHLNPSQTGSVIVVE